MLCCRTVEGESESQQKSTKWFLSNRRDNQRQNKEVAEPSRKKRIAGMKEWLNTSKLWSSAVFQRRQDASEWLEGILRSLGTSTQRTPPVINSDYEDDNLRYYRTQESRNVGASTRFLRHNFNHQQQPTSAVRKFNFNQIKLKPQLGQSGRQASFSPVNMNVFKLEQPITFRPTRQTFNPLREQQQQITTLHPVAAGNPPHSPQTTAPYYPIVPTVQTTPIPYIVPVNNLAESDPDGTSYLPRPIDTSPYLEEDYDYDLVDTATPAPAPVATTPRNVIRVDVYLKYIPNQF